MAMLAEVDSVKIEVIVDNEVDPLSDYRNPGFESVTGRFLDLAMASPYEAEGRAEAKKVMAMELMCCGAHGLSLVITATKDGKSRTILFDTGPEENVWELNAGRVKPELAQVEAIHLSHWHIDHSGGMLRAIKLIKAAKAASPTAPQDLVADLHPNRPDYRGFLSPKGHISLPADPSFEQIEAAGAKVSTSDQTHTILDDTFLVSGEIPRETSYELGMPYGLRFSNATGAWAPDEKIVDERFVACNVRGKGLVVFTGCSHAGVVNVSRHAARLAPGVPLFAIMGGYHLIGIDDSVVEQTVRDLKLLDPKILMPGHCSGWRAKFEIERQMPGRLAPSTVSTKFVI